MQDSKWTIKQTSCFKVKNLDKALSVNTFLTTQSLLSALILSNWSKFAYTLMTYDLCFFGQSCSWKDLNNIDHYKFGVISFTNHCTTFLLIYKLFQKLKNVLICIIALQIVFSGTFFHHWISRNLIIKEHWNFQSKYWYLCSFKQLFHFFENHCSLDPGIFLAKLNGRCISWWYFTAIFKQFKREILLSERKRFKFLIKFWVNSKFQTFLNP